MKIFCVRHWARWCFRYWKSAFC